MAKRRIALLACLFLSATSLALGFLASRSPAAALSAALGLCMFFRLKPAAGWIPAAYLVASTCAAATGVLLKAPAPLMAVATASAIASWDLANLDRALAANPSSAAGKSPEGKRLLVLAAAIAPGMILCIPALILRLSIPFAVLFPAAILDLLCLWLAAHELRKDGEE